MAAKFGRSPLQGSLIKDPEPSATVNRGRPIGKLNMPAAIKLHFQMLPAHAWQTTREVQDGVIALGKKGGKSLRGHVYNTLHRLSQPDGPFVRGERGTWALRAWGHVGE